MNSTNNKWNNDQQKIFEIKKWALFTACGVGILATVIVAAVVAVQGHFYDEHVEQKDTPNSHYYSKTIDVTKNVFALIDAVPSIVFYIIGLIAVYKEHYCMTLAFAVLLSLNAIASIVVSVYIPGYWVCAVMDFLVCGLAYLFSQAIRERRMNTARQSYLNTGRQL